MKAILALETVQKKREDRYDRFVRLLDRKRDELATEVAVRGRALSGGQQAKAQRIVGGILGECAERLRGDSVVIGRRCVLSVLWFTPSLLSQP